MLCHRARVSAGFRVRGMNTCGDFRSSTLLFGVVLCGLTYGGSGVLRRWEAADGLRTGGPGRWVDEAEPLSVQLGLGWISRRALHRVGKQSRRRSRCHSDASVDDSARVQRCHLKSSALADASAVRHSFNGSGQVCLGVNS